MHALDGGEALIERVRVTGTRVDQAAAYGDGVVAMLNPLGKGSPSKVLVRDSLVEASQRANLLYEAAGGQVERTLVRRGVFSVALEKDAAPFLAATNVLEGNQENRVSYGEALKPVPPLVLPPAP